MAASAAICVSVCSAQASAAPAVKAVCKAAYRQPGALMVQCKLDRPSTLTMHIEYKGIYALVWDMKCGSRRPITKYLIPLSTHPKPQPGTIATLQVNPRSNKDVYKLMHSSRSCMTYLTVLMPKPGQGHWVFSPYITYTRRTLA